MAARRRSGVRAVLTLLLVVVLVGLLGILADRTARKATEGRVSHQLQVRLGTAIPPAVVIEGSPFLTQVLSQSVDSVHVVADDIVGTGVPAVPVARMDVRLHQVTSSDWFKTMVAGRVDGMATMTYPAAQSLIQLPVTFAGDGRLEVKIQTAVVSVPVTASIVGRPSLNVEDQTLTLADPQITVAGVDVAETTSQALLNQLVKPIPVTGIPLGLSLTQIGASDRGITATVTGTHVALTQ